MNKYSKEDVEAAIRLALPEGWDGDHDRFIETGWYDEPCELDVNAIVSAIMDKLQ